MVLSDKGFRQAPFERSTPKLPVMTYVIGKECVDVMHKDCVQECPAYCIYERARSLYINQYECVDCGACKLICEVGAIYYETDLPEDERRSTGISGGCVQGRPGRRRHPVCDVAACADLSHVRIALIACATAGRPVAG